MDNNAGHDNCLPLGTVLHGDAGGYKIAGVLASGSYGITYKAEFIVHGNLGETNSGALFAIKECFISQVNGRDGLDVTGTDVPLFSQALRRFKEESKMLSDIHHPGVISVIDAFEANSTAYYVMEYIDGGNIDHAISSTAERRLPEQRALELIHQTGEAIGHIHSLGMAHLDIKPGNIMLRHGESAAVIDFGISRFFGPDGRPRVEDDGAVGSGTEGYAPPEQNEVHFERPLLPPMDIYSLGATLYKMLTGHRPPKASEVAKEGFPTGRLKECGVSDATIAAVTKAMSPTVEARFDSVAAFLASLPKPEPADDELEIISVERPGHTSESAHTSESRHRGQHRPRKRKKPQPAPAPAKKSVWPKIGWIIGIVLSGLLMVGVAKRCSPSQYAEIIGDTHNTKYGHTVPSAFELCTERGGETFYFTAAEWNSVPPVAKPLYQPRGVYMTDGGRAFIVALDEDSHHLTWQQAEHRYGDEIPTYEEAQTILKYAFDLQSALSAFGGRRMEGSYWIEPLNNPKAMGHDNRLKFYTGNWSRSSMLKVRRVYSAGN